MGTRNLTLVKENNTYKIAQYGQWDGYPSGNGITVLNFCKDSTLLTKLKNNLSKIGFLSAGEEGAFDDLDTQQKELAFQESLWSRDIGADILQKIANIETRQYSTMFMTLIMREVTKLQNSINFAKDSLFCEWAYCINFDTQKLEIFTGFNKSPLSKYDEFYFDNFYEASHDGTRFYPIRKIKEYELSNLPSEEVFLNDLEPKEEDGSDDSTDSSVASDVSRDMLIDGTNPS